MRVCVLIPAFNEARHIEAVIQGVQAHLEDILVYDDGSKDDTAAIAERAGARVMRHEVNQGKGATLADGLAWIADHGFDAALALDADGQHRPDEIPRFLEAMEQADLIVGSRMSECKSMPFVRWATNVVMSWLVSRLARASMPDTQCGFRLVRCAAWKRMVVRTRNFDFESEMLVNAGRQGMRILSVPVSTVYGDEESKINPILDSLRFFKMVWRLYWRDTPAATPTVAPAPGVETQRPPSAPSPDAPTPAASNPAASSPDGPGPDASDADPSPSDAAKQE